MRFLYLAGAVVTAILLVLLLVALTMPVAAFSQFYGGGFHPLAGARVVHGAALAELEGPGAAVVKWRWCPGEGLSAICIEASAHGARWTAVVAPGPGRIEVRELTVSGWRMAVPWLTGSAPGAVVRGEVHGAALPWRSACISQLLTTAGGGRFFVTLPAAAESDAGEIQLKLTASDGNRMELVGDGIAGDFRVEGERLDGVIRVHPRFLNPGVNGDEAMVNLNLSRTLPCTGMVKR